MSKAFEVANRIFDDWYFNGSGKSQALLAREEWEPLVRAFAQALEEASKEN
jgi:hypothetical protein